MNYEIFSHNLYTPFPKEIRLPLSTKNSSCCRIFALICLFFGCFRLSTASKSYISSSVKLAWYSELVRKPPYRFGV